MKRLGRFVWLDTYALLAVGRKYVALQYLMACVLAVLGGQPLGIVFAPVMAMVLLPAMWFLSDRVTRRAGLHALLPVSRAVVVVGRYLTALVLFPALALIGVVLAVMLGLWRNYSVRPAELVVTLAVVFVLYTVTAAVQFPLLLLSDAWVDSRPVAEFHKLASHLALYLPLVTFDRDPPKVLVANPTLTGGGCLAIGLLALSCSAAVSVRGLRARNLWPGTWHEEPIADRAGVSDNIYETHCDGSSRPGATLGLLRQIKM